MNGRSTQWGETWSGEILMFGSKKMLNNVSDVTNLNVLIIWVIFMDQIIDQNNAFNCVFNITAICSCFGDAETSNCVAINAWNVS